jgi:hypothetical protein
MPLPVIERKRIAFIALPPGEGETRRRIEAPAQQANGALEELLRRHTNAGGMKLFDFIKDTVSFAGGSLRRLP